MSGARQAARRRRSTRRPPASPTLLPRDMRRTVLRHGRKRHSSAVKAFCRQLLGERGNQPGNLRLQTY
jgi:hypothetical protein